MALKISKAPQGSSSGNIDIFLEKLPKLQSESDQNFFTVIDSDQFLNSCKQAFGQRSSFKHFVLIGMGGSTLGPEAIISSLNKSSINFHFLNNSDPDLVAKTLSEIEYEETLFYVVSKSGSTIETLSIFDIIVSHFKIKNEDLKNNFIFASEPGPNQLRDFANKYSIECLEIPPSLGGRYCVLGVVGLLPALAAELDPEELIRGAGDIKKSFLCCELEINNLANEIFKSMKEGRTQTVLMPYASSLKTFCNWFVQLWAESLGKKKKNGEATGLTPIASIGATDQHSQLQLFVEGLDDKFFLFIKTHFKNDFQIQNQLNLKTNEILKTKNLSELIHAQLEGTKKSLTDISRPVFEIEVDEINEYHFGQLFMFFEILTVLVSIPMEINPFDQPGVESSKINTKQLLQS